MTTKTAAIPEPVQHLLAGTAAGMTSKTIEFPFDTLKVRLQTHAQFKGPLDCLTQTVQQDGLSALYKGLSAPLAAAMFENAIGFSIYGNSLPLFQTHFPHSPVLTSALSGSLAGIGLGVFLTPVELVKCRLQSVHSTFTGPIHCLREMALSRGGLRGNLFQGLGATLCREVPGGAVYFGVYEWACGYFGGGKVRADIEPWVFLLSGSAAGMSYWTVIFPFDSIKSRIQVGQSGNVSGLIRSQGVKVLYRGLGVTLLRALPANAVLFGTYEYVLYHLQ